MAKRREKGDGSIYQRESDKMWVACVRVPEIGKRKYVYAKTRREVAAKLKELQRSIDQGTLVTAKAETVETYLAYWLEIQKASIKQGTYWTYRSYIHVCLPHIGHIKLTKLTGDQLQKMYMKLAEERKTSTMRTIHTILLTAFKRAIRWKRLVHNPCMDIDAPHVEKEERPVLSADQAKALLNAAQGTALECFLTMALTTGMRRGEMLGLRWADIDIEQKTLRVQRTASYIKNQEGTHTYIETTPKTKASRRSIHLTQFLIDALKLQKRKQNEVRLQSGQKWVDGDLVFCNKVGEHFHVNALTREYKKLLQENDLPHLHIHDLRHSASTLLASMKVPAKVIQEILGHSSIMITQDLYGHVIEGMQEEAMQKMDSLFRKDGTM